MEVDSSICNKIWWEAEARKTNNLCIFRSIKSAVWLGAAEFLGRKFIYEICMVLASSE